MDFPIQEFMSNGAITAIGSYVPERRLTNEDLSAMVETNDEWIVRRTGIRERRVAAEGEFSSHLAAKAVEDLLRRYPTETADIDAVIVATTTPDTPFPSVAARIQNAFGIRSCLAFDMNAACAGFVSGLQIANGLLLTGAYRKILVVGVETLTRITDYTDRSTCILFGDGAGAVLVEKAEQGTFLASDAATDGSGGGFVYASGLSKEWNGLPLEGDGKIVQNGQEVYKWAVTRVPEGIRRMLGKAGLTADELDWFVPHSANLRMIEAMCERLGLPPEKALHSVTAFGNTSAASIPLALDLAVKDGRLVPGQLAALYGFGSGLSQAGLLLRWTI
ncbi:3-oxoacyl-[acyl-carrier-protein] synthase 3 protein 2 [Cohnella xylanilytica]|uniref:Beta-ketoacyl-[acyl-carrier-protein] synthase III n=1 Tax=Cohnella xylanilytica TaxID=557555 RepID=A0A841U876_9BACL|nr:ketoacyl-ACP synthase III [Cohnella xylanilytica]MBB6694160.1 ketoacyl-ACP synthase III [Cohnella xylanilytica]GIO11036.1 3-oxoacyl-[acyl-carrier-protein] synthase 3 protein 2 [Cohnella xylanilytica]